MPASAPSITVTPSNSPYAVPGPSATYATVTLQGGGYLQLSQQTTLTITTLVKS